MSCTFIAYDLAPQPLSQGKIPSDFTFLAHTHLNELNKSLEMSHFYCTVSPLKSVQSASIIRMLIVKGPLQ